MKNKKDALKILMLFVFTSICNCVTAQSELKIFQDWASTSGTQNFFYKNIVKTDANGYVYIAGATVNDSNNYDILVAKYSPRGTLQWMQQYDGAGHGDDMAVGLYIDGNGYVYITGTITTLTNVDAVTIKYNSSGIQQWLTTYDGTGGTFDSGSDIITDGSGNVYITGSSYNANANTDVITVKYNSTGTQQWVCRYDFTSNLNDAGVKLNWNNGNLDVGMFVQNNSSSYRYGTLKYNTNGTLIITQLSLYSISSGINQVGDIIKDASGNIYIAGALPVSGQGLDYDIIKLNSNLSLAWQRTYSGSSSLDDIATGLKVDGSGNVYVSGTSATSNEGKNIVTLKYNSSGTLQWSRTYNDTLNKDDEANALAMDATGNIYITGSCSTESDSMDFFTMKYDAAGNLLWTIQSDGNAHLDDKANNLVIDNNGDIIVTGESRTSAGSFEYLTIKYVEKQIITPTDYNSETPASSFSYYTNKGQLINTNDSLIPEIKYYTNGSSPAFYFKDNSNSFVFAHVDANDSTSDTLHRIDMSFEKINSTAKTYPMEETRDYLNYFLPQCPDGITKVHGNKRLITTGLYSNIDLMYSSNQNGIKMYFIIKPGGSPTDLQLLFSGASSFYLDTASNALTINSSIGNITFDRPTAYQLTSSNTIVQITGWQCAWQTNGTDSTYKFYTGAYDNTKALVIQVDEGNGIFSNSGPNYNMEWSTYFGGSSYDWCKDVETNSANDVWVLGETFYPDFPLSAGVNTSQFTDDDCFAVKFDVNAHPQWITYFGGSAWDGVSDMKLDSKENVYIVGSTASVDFPHTISAGINYSMNGTQDGYFIVFNNLGSGIYCDSYIGGNSWDYPYSLDILDNSGESNKIVVIGGITYSGSDFPVHENTNAYYQTDDFESRNAFIMRLDYTYSNVWCSLFGGSGDEAFTDVTINYNGDRIVACGWSSTSDYSTDLCAVPSDGGFPLCTPSNAYYQPFVGVNEDLMIAEFNNSNQLVWSTYFGGNTDDIGSAEGKPNPRICFVGDDIYLATTVPTNLLSTFPLHTSTYPNAYNQQLANSSNDHNFNVVISRFNFDREQSWCTAFGGYSVGLTSAGMSLNDICSGPNNTIFLTGSADADYVQTSNLCSAPSTASEFPICNYSGGNYLENDAGTTNLDEHREFIAAFNNNDNLIWSSRFGLSSFLSEGYGIATSSDKLFVVGHCELQTSQEYTLWELDQAHIDPLDYFQSNDYSNSSGTISRFDISEITSSIDEIEFENNIIISPNPASDYIEIQLKNTVAEFEKFFIYDALGSLIACKEIINNEQIIQINISALPQGFYLLRIIDSRGLVYSGKFIKL